MVGAGDGNRTHDIQLGKLDSFQLHQGNSCKTAALGPQLHQWVTADSQNRFQKARQGAQRAPHSRTLRRHQHPSAAQRRPAIIDAALRRRDKPLGTTVEGCRMNAPLRHYCRNQHCRSKLAEPVDSERRAFCTRGCHATFYRHRCVVCEKSITRRTETQRLCGSGACAYAHKQNPEVYGFQGSIVAPTPRSGSKTLINWAFKSGGLIGRGWRWNDAEDAHDLVNQEGKIVASLRVDGDGYLITHPRAHPAHRAATLEGARKLAASLALADLLLAPTWAARVARNNANVKENPQALVQRHTSPVNLIGGYRFGNAPVLDASLVQTVVATERELVADYVDEAPDLVRSAADDDLDIPPFLRRTARQAGNANMGAT
jgi:hypothetical protein